MFINKLIPFALGLILLFLPACDNRRTTQSDTTEVTYTLDRHEPSPMFWDYAASTSMLQTELSKLASEKSQDSMILTFADSALVIHSKALTRLRRIAEKYKHIQLPDSLTGSDKEMVEEFKLLEGKEFEKRYLEYLMLNHKAQLNRYQETLNETEDPALRQWLNTMRTRLRSQLQFYAEADTVTEVEKL
jgi:putative membrane protein